MVTVSAMAPMPATLRRGLHVCIEALKACNRLINEGGYEHLCQASVQVEEVVEQRMLAVANGILGSMSCLCIS